MGLGHLYLCNKYSDMSPPITLPRYCHIAIKDTKVLMLFFGYPSDVPI